MSEDWHERTRDIRQTLKMFAAGLLAFVLLCLVGIAIQLFMLAVLAVFSE